MCVCVCVCAHVHHKLFLLQRSTESELHTFQNKVELLQEELSTKNQEIKELFEAVECLKRVTEIIMARVFVNFLDLSLRMFMLLLSEIHLHCLILSHHYIRHTQHPWIILVSRIRWYNVDPFLVCMYMYTY